MWCSAVLYYSDVVKCSVVILQLSGAVQCYTVVQSKSGVYMLVWDHAKKSDREVIMKIVIMEMIIIH
jgi:hypothetical protein